MDTQTDSPAAAWATSAHAGLASAPAPLGAASRAERAVAINYDDATHKNMQLLVQLRWIAVVGQIATIGVVYFGFAIALPLHAMLIVVGCLAVFNVVSMLHWRTHRVVPNYELFVALLVDVGVLTAQLYLSGGATNPFVFLYLLQVMLGAVLLKPWLTWSLVATTVACVAGLAMFSGPPTLPLDHDLGLRSHYIQGMLICFVLVASLLVVFVGRIHRNLRKRDARLADLRQRAAEEEHIVRIGLLASGAAHELGTPLATLSVILGDWYHMPAFSSDPVLLEEVEEMQAQVTRCKAILSGILQSAGETRGDDPEKTTILEFLDDVVQEWESTRPVESFSYDNRFGHDMPVVSDSALQQMICNVLDNALEASPHHLSLLVDHVDDALVLTVTDMGPGFRSDILEQFGKPYQSSKGRPGGGLGLFLSVNVARTLGGTVAARNRPEGGAEVIITLPLAAITLEDKHDRVH